MNRWTRKVVTCASIISAVALVPVGTALAQEAPAAPQLHEHAHRAGLLAAALKLDSLTPDQRTAIEALRDQRHAAAAPVRAANAELLTLLAQEVEQGTIDTQALAPALGAEHSAAVAESAVEEGVLNRLHALLTPAERSQVVDSVEAAHEQSPRHHQGEPGKAGKLGWGGKLGLTPEQKSQIAANLATERAVSSADGGNERARRKEALEAFRGDSFDANQARALVQVEGRGDREEKLARAVVPVLSRAQRATLASGLRARAAREAHTPRHS
jgi:Spy/CpxP family protein refolding chaperone